MRLIPALQDLYRDAHPYVVVQKAAQVFVSEYLINTALWAADTGQGGRGNALYVMPTQNQVDDFSQARVDKAIAESSHLMQRLYPTPPQKGGPVRQRLKRVGLGYLYFRGADSRGQLTSVDADIVLLDEYDLMAEGVLERAQKRLASSQLGWLRVASTPRLPEAGINGIFLQSDQRYYFLKCAGCGLWQRLAWEKNVDVTCALLVCRRSRCRKPLDLWSPGRWEAAAPGNHQVHGYHLNRLYSPRANLRQIIYESQATTPAAMQEFQNSVLGETFIPPGGRLTLDVLDRCRRDYTLPERCGTETYMGVDVGLRLHVVIRRQLEEDKRRSRAVFIGEVGGFEELAGLVQRYRVCGAVVDAMPEQRGAVRFAKETPNARVGLAYYGRIDPGFERSHDQGVWVYRINRTEALEETFYSFQTQESELPQAARQLGGHVRDGLGDYYRQLLAISRVLEQNAQGNWVARFTDQGRPDHYAHAETYCRVAMKAGAIVWRAA